MKDDKIADVSKNLYLIFIPGISRWPRECGSMPECLFVRRRRVNFVAVCLGFDAANHVRVERGNGVEADDVRRYYIGSVGTTACIQTVRCVCVVWIV